MSITGALKAIFSEEKIDTLEKAGKLVEGLLSSLGAKQEEAKIEMDEENQLGWLIQVGDIYLYIYIFQMENNFLYIKMVSPLVYMPETNLLPFYRKLLEYNVDFHDIGFGVEKNVVMILAQRKIDYTSLEECRFIIEFIAKTGNLLNKELIKEFGSKPYQLD